MPIVITQSMRKIRPARFLLKLKSRRQVQRRDFAFNSLVIRWRDRQAGSLVP
jgi:hypothetical protein